MNDIIFFYWRTFILFHFVLFILYKVVVKFVQSKRELIYKIFIQDIIFFSSFMKINSTKIIPQTGSLLRYIFDNDLFNIYNSDIQFKICSTI